jgi:hypothetical protein
MRWAGAVLASALALAAPAQAAEPDFYGPWQITEARTAPWAKAESAFSAEEQHRLIGSKVIYAKTRITGPAPLGCEKPHYRFLEAAPDYLFQGGLTDDPAAQAAALGFRLQTIPTLETGCAGWIDFHFVDARTALFGLNNMIYTLRKQ